MPAFNTDIPASLLFERLMESLQDQIYFKDLEGRFICVSRGQARYLGLSSPAEAIGKTDYDYYAADRARQMDADEREIIRTGVGFADKEERTTSLGGVQRWALASKLPLRGADGQIIGTYGISRDITESRHAREMLEEQHRLMKTLIEILPCQIFVKDREGRIRLANEAYRRAVGAGSAKEIEGRRLDELMNDPRIDSAAADDRRVLEKGEQIVNREELDAILVGDGKWSLLSKVPLRDSAGRIEGLVGMAADITPQKDAEARAIRIQHELEQKNREIEAELGLARELQTELMALTMESVRSELDTAAPFCPDLVFHYEPSAHLAGDFFQFMPVSDGVFGLLLCDVMGHGVKAALVTTLIRGLLADVKAEQVRPGEVMAYLNTRLCPLLDHPPLPRFVTALSATIDIRSGRMLLASAGHPWPLRQPLRGEAAPISPQQCAPALGLVAGAEFATEEHQLEAGDRVLFFTDGWTEETAADGEEFGRDRLAAALVAQADRAPTEALAALAAAVRQYSGRESRADDLCAILAAFPGQV